MRKLTDLLLYCGAPLLAVGVFLPMTRFAVVGDVSYYDLTATVSLVVAGCAVALPILLQLKMKKWVWLPIVGIWGALFWPKVQQQFQDEPADLFAQLSSKAQASIDAFVADVLWNIPDYSWGGYVFLVGLVACTLGALLARVVAR